MKGQLKGQLKGRERPVQQRGWQWVGVTRRLQASEGGLSRQKTPALHHLERRIRALRGRSIARRTESGCWRRLYGDERQLQGVRATVGRRRGSCKDVAAARAWLLQGRGSCRAWQLQGCGSCKGVAAARAWQLQGRGSCKGVAPGHTSSTGRSTGSRPGRGSTRPSCSPAKKRRSEKRLLKTLLTRPW